MYIWYTHGVINREVDEGPAFLSDNEARYFVNGKLHNFDKYPAVTRRSDNMCTYEYWNNGLFLERKNDTIKLLPLTNVFQFIEKYENGIKVGTSCYHHLYKVIYKIYEKYIPDDEGMKDETYYLEQVPDYVKTIILHFHNKPIITHILNFNNYTLIRSYPWTSDHYLYFIDPKTNNIYSHNYKYDKIMLVGTFLCKADFKKNRQNINNYKFTKYHIGSILLDSVAKYYKPGGDNSVIFGTNQDMNLIFNTSKTIFDFDKLIKQAPYLVHCDIIIEKLLLNNTPLEIIFSYFFIKHLLRRFVSVDNENYFEPAKYYNTNNDNYNHFGRFDWSLNFNKFKYLEMIEVMINRGATPYIDIQYLDKTVNLIELIEICKTKIEQRYDDIIKINSDPHFGHMEYIDIYKDEIKSISNYMDKMISAMTA